MIVEAGKDIGRTLAALSVLNGYDTDAELADAITSAGYPVSQQSINNYRRNRNNPPVGFIVGFVKALDLPPEQSRSVLRTYMDENPDLEDFLRLWATI